MKDEYLEKKDWDEIEDRMKIVIDETLHCWIGTRVNGISASLVCDGNVSVYLLKQMDIIKEKSNCNYPFIPT